MASTSLLVLFAIFAIFALLSVTRAQDRAPHGLVYESPIAMSPQAYEFFHPDTQMASIKSPLDAETLSPLPLAATVQSDVAHESRSTPEAGKTGAGAGAIAGIVVSLVAAVVLAMGVYYAVITRKTNLKNRAKSAQPDV